IFTLSIYLTFSRRKVNALVVGLDKAGKTSTTRGCVRMELRVENFLVSLLDIGGAPEVRGSWGDLYGEVHGFIFVVNSSDQQSIKEVQETHEVTDNLYYLNPLKPQCDHLQWARMDSSEAD
uniref:Uncharacterized protein n=1 Tax=Oncorhynchus mykiss TaxID=8022 RepID=A0A8K9XBQ5_ONCMY